MNCTKSLLRTHMASDRVSLAITVANTLTQQREQRPRRRRLMSQSLTALRIQSVSQLYSIEKLPPPPQTALHASARLTSRRPLMLASPHKASATLPSCVHGDNSNDNETHSQTRYFNSSQQTASQAGMKLRQRWTWSVTDSCAVRV